jgi:hypothetical protein
MVERRIVEPREGWEKIKASCQGTRVRTRRRRLWRKETAKMDKGRQVAAR